MRTHTRYRLALLGFSLVVFSALGCSNDLSRREALQVLRKHIEVPRNEEAKLTKGRIIKNLIKEAIEAKAVEVSSDGDGPWVKVNPTAEARKAFLIREDSESYYLKACDVDIKITGVQMLQEGQARVTWEYTVNRTPFWSHSEMCLSYVRGAPYPMIFGLFDDGWRVTRVGG